MDLKGLITDNVDWLFSGIGGKVVTGFYSCIRRKISNILGHNSYTDAQIELDKKLYKRLRSMFGEGDTIRFICENNFAGYPYIRSMVYPLFDFEQEAIMPEFEFIDKEMNELLMQLKTTVLQFNDLLANNTFPVDDKLHQVPPEWEYQQSERFLKVVNGLHDLGRKTWDIWGLLVRTGREKYGI